MWPNAELRDRVGQLEAHLQRAGGSQREVEVGDEQRQQRREDVAVAVDDEVRARQQQDGAVQSERSPPSRPVSCVIAAIVAAAESPSRTPLVNSRMRSSHAAAASTVSATPIVSAKPDDLIAGRSRRGSHDASHS